MDNRKYETKEEVLERGREIIGIPLHEVDRNGKLGVGKGDIGSVVEESWFGYQVNSNSGPDFAEAGVELKVTPYIFNSKGIRAKERLVCNIINYMEEHSKTFETSSFWKKCNTILLMLYEHINGMDKGDFTIDEVAMFYFPVDDLLIIKKDWESIITKICNGKAHELSEGDTNYLGACTKGGKKTKPRQQPFSDLRAKQRAFSLKQSYMTHVISNYIFKESTPEHIIKDTSILRNKKFEEYICETVMPYIGWSQHRLLNALNIQTTAKNVNEIIFARLLGVQGKLAATDEFQKANIIPKTIRIRKNGRIIESMPFPEFRFSEIIEETWEESVLKNYLEPARFLFVVFKENNDGEYIFKHIKFWNISPVDLDEVRVVWERTVQTVMNGVKLEYNGKRVSNNLPKQSENRVAHVRPKSKKRAYRFDDVDIGRLQDADELPNGRWMTKQCFWFKNTYVRYIINDDS